MTASEDDSPYLDILTHSGSPWSSISTKVRLGNLSGISDEDFGGSLSGYGLYAENVYLKGKMIITGGNASVTFYQDVEPGSSGDSNVPKNGDYWIDTNDSNKLYTYQDGWVEITSSGGITTFKQSSTTSGEGIPISLHIGDLWIDSDNSKLYRASIVGADEIGIGEWELQNTALATGWAHSSDTTKIDGGDIYVGSSITIGVDGNIKIGQTAYDTGSGFWVGYVGGAYKLSIGNSGGTDKITWDGTTLTIRGSLNVDDLNVSQLDAICANTGTLNVDESITVGTAGKVVIDGVNECHKIYDASNNLMVKIGKLS
jgi:hypothetical protein